MGYGSIGGLCVQAVEQQHIDHPLVLDVLEKYSALINK